MIKQIIRETTIKNVLKISLLSFGLFPIIPNTIKGLPVVVLLLCSIYYFITNKKKEFNGYFFLANASIYIIYLFSLIYSSNINYALRKLETGLSLLLIPLIFSLIWNLKDIFNKENIFKQFKLIYFNSVFIYACIILIFLVNIGLFNYFEDPNFVRHFTKVIPIIGQHSIYASIFLGLGLLFSLHVFNLKKTIFSKFIFFIQVFIILILLVSLASKGVLIASAFSIIFYSIFQIKNKKNKIILLGLICLTFVAAVKFSPSLSARIGSFTSALHLTSYEGSISSTQTRKAIYTCAWKSLGDYNWILGYGLGDVKDILMDCYKEYSLYLVKGKFNSHNQYLSLLIGTGFLGLTSLIYILSIYYRKGIKNKDYFFLSILIFYTCIMFIENILERQSGIILFLFLTNLFFLKEHKKEA